MKMLDADGAALVGSQYWEGILLAMQEGVGMLRGQHWQDQNQLCWEDQLEQYIAHHVSLDEGETK